MFFRMFLWKIKDKKENRKVFSKFFASRVFFIQRLLIERFHTFFPYYHLQYFDFFVVFRRVRIHEE